MIVSTVRYVSYIIFGIVDEFCLSHRLNPVLILAGTLQSFEHAHTLSAGMRFA